MLHVSKGIQQNQLEIIKRTRLEFKEDIAYVTSNIIVAADGLVTMPNSA